MKRSIIIKVLSGLLNILTCLIGTLVVLSFQDWFGSNDIYPLLFWTIPLSTGLVVSGKNILTLFRTQNRILRLLLIILTAILIPFAFVYLVSMFLGSWINAFSLPIFHLWIVGTFVQLLFLDLFLLKITKKIKPIKTLLKIVILPITIILTIIGMYMISFLNAYLTRPEPETFLIPDNYAGKIRIVYGEECGVNPLIENGRRVLQIPNSGLLIIKPKFKAGIIDHEYYFVDSNGNRTIANRNNGYEDQSRGVQLSGSGSIGGAMPDGSSSSESPLAIHFTDFYVHSGSSNEFTNKEYTAQEKRIDSLTRASVKDCRKKQKAQ